MTGVIFFLFTVILVISLLVSNITMVPQSWEYIIESFGAYKTVWGVGFHLKLPFIERIAKRVSLKEQIADFPPTSVITKDNVTVVVDSVIFFQITDSKLFTYGVSNPIQAIDQLTGTTLRNIFGSLEFDDVLTARDLINNQAREALDKATDPWGIKVNRVELKQITPPKDVQDAMEKQMKAERERREKILQAEGNKQSSILNAEGEKQSALLRAEAEKQTAIMRAEAEKQVIMLKAEADAEAKLKAADAEAESIRRIREAEALSYERLAHVKMSPELLKVLSLETFEKVADGKATKLIIPSEMQSVASLLASAKEVVESDSKVLSSENYEDAKLVKKDYTNMPVEFM